MNCCDVQTTTTSHHIQASYERTTCFCWRHWTSSSRVFSVNFTPTMLSTRPREMTSALSGRRSERTRSYCQCSVASLLNTFNCFSVHSTTAGSHMSATSSTTAEVCRHLYLHSVNFGPRNSVVCRALATHYRARSPIT